MKLNFITFLVRDIEKSVRFYTELAGLQVVNRITPKAGEIVFLANEQGETMLEFIAVEDAVKVSVKGMAMSFTVNDELETVREKAIALGYSPSEVREIGPKPKYFMVMDPDGIPVEFSV